MFRDRFYVSLILTIPVVLYSGILRTLFGIEPPTFPGSGRIPLIGVGGILSGEDARAKTAAGASLAIPTMMIPSVHSTRKKPFRDILSRDLLHSNKRRDIRSG